jgi:hypothetical protein
MYRGSHALKQLCVNRAPKHSRCTLQVIIQDEGTDCGAANQLALRRLHGWNNAQPDFGFPAQFLQPIHIRIGFEAEMMVESGYDVLRVELAQQNPHEEVTAPEVLQFKGKLADGGVLHSGFFKQPQPHTNRGQVADGLPGADDVGGQRVIGVHQGFHPVIARDVNRFINKAAMAQVNPVKHAQAYNHGRAKILLQFLNLINSHKNPPVTNAEMHNEQAKYYHAFPLLSIAAEGKRCAVFSSRIETPSATQVSE